MSTEQIIENELLMVGNLPISKNAIMGMAEQAVLAVDGGEVDPLKLYVQCTAVIELAEAVKKRIKFKVEQEAEKYDLKTERPFGCLIKATSTPTKWDYSQSDDWVAMKKELDYAKEDLKSLEKKLQIAEVAVKVGGGERCYSVTLPE